MTIAVRRAMADDVPRAPTIGRAAVDAAHGHSPTDSMDRPHPPIHVRQEDA